MSTILLVEDNQLVRDMILRRLRLQGYTILTADDGSQAIALALTERPNLILMDISLPGLDGWQATRQIRALPTTHAIPIIALTAHAMSEDRAKCLEAGCNEYETKPIDFSRLLVKIQALLAQTG
jgi:two-component system cell cycle response regulator DivK